MALSVAAGVAAAQPITGPVAGNTFAVTGVRVFDGADTLDDATVIVRDGLIDRMGRSVRIPRGIPSIDGTGQTLIPGLIDAHTHALGQDEVLADALRFGVTTELNMAEGAPFVQRHKRRRESVERTQLADLWSSGPPATAPGPMAGALGYRIPPVASPAEADKFVRERLAEGSAYIKIHYEPGSALGPSISRETLEALVAAAHAHGTKAVVHVATLAAARDAAAAGADGLVHAFGDMPIDDALLRTMAENDMFVVATLVVFGDTRGRSWRELIQDPRTAPYLSAAQTACLKLDERVPRPQANAETLRATVNRLHAAGIDVLAGTDVGPPGTTHGASLHGELNELVQAGLTPAEALAAATGVTAERFGLKDRGRIAPNLRADLVLVAGDPTTDITATRSIVRVFKNGFEVDRNVPAAALGAAPSLAACVPPGLAGLIR